MAGSGQVLEGQMTRCGSSPASAVDGPITPPSTGAGGAEPLCSKYSCIFELTRILRGVGALGRDACCRGEDCCQMLTQVKREAGVGQRTLLLPFQPHDLTPDLTSPCRSCG